MPPRPKLRLGLLGLGLGLLAACALSPQEPSTSPESVDAARALHQRAIVLDGHNDLPTWMLDFRFDLGMDGADPAKRSSELYWVLDWLLPAPEGDDLQTHTDLTRMRAGGLDAQIFSIFVEPRFIDAPGGASGRANAMIDALEAQVQKHSDDFEMATEVAEVRRIVAEGKIAALMAIEGGHAVEADLDLLRSFYDRGVRAMAITWSNTNEWADSSDDVARHGGLSPFGVEVIKEMNRLGMVIDVSHSADDTVCDVLRESQAPIMASHSAARALVESPRNLSDPLLRAIAENGGVVMVNFAGITLDARKATTAKIALDLLTHAGPSRVPLSNLLDHIEHVAKVAGIDHVGLGSDFDGTLFMPEGVRDVSGFPNITLGLAARGWSESDLRKVLGENALRVLEEVDAQAKP